MKDAASGKYILARSGDDLETLANTIVHELFHAFMDDYNRLGLFGIASLENGETDAEDSFINKEAAKEYAATRLPSWFVEGTASSVENVYQYRKPHFELLTSDSGEGSLAANILNNYQNALYDGKPAHFDLVYSGGADTSGEGVDASTANYVTGYLAILYLSDLAYRTENDGESAISRTDDGYAVSTEKLRLGLNYLLVWLHDDSSTLDSIIAHISPVDDQGKKLYDSTAAFSNRFIKGVPNAAEDDEPATYSGDDKSLAFVTAYLYCLQQIEEETGFIPNGSILFDVDKDYTCPLDLDKTDRADFYKIIESNTLVESSVKSDTGAIGGGKSYSSDSPYAGDNSQAAGTMNAAAKQKANEPVAEDASQETTVESDAGAEAAEASEDAPQDDVGNDPASESADDLDELPLAA